MTEKEIYKNGVALLEEWEDVNYCEHSFKFKDEWLTDKEVVDLLSQLNDENERLIREKERYKTLHAIAHEQIDNRILTIQHFVEECSDDKVKKALKKLLCTKVQEYDVSAKNRALIVENEQLTEKNNELKEILKHTYETHECETCKHNQYFNWLDPATMKREYDSKCGKGLNYGEEVHGCEEYELDLEMFKKRVKM